MKLFPAKCYERKLWRRRGNSSPLLHVIRACIWRWPDVVAGISARFPKFAFVLFCYITNHFMTGPLGNSEFCFPRISMFPRIRLGKHWESRETKFTVPLGTSHYTTRYFVTPIQSNSAPLNINIMSARTLYSCRARQWDKKIDGLKRKKKCLLNFVCYCWMLWTFGSCFFRFEWAKVS